MLAAIASLLLCQLAGEAIVRATLLPVPGPVVGMVLLFVLLVARARLPAALGITADTLLKHLSLLFVPAGVGVVQHIERLGQSGLQLIVIVMITTVIALAVTALTFEYLARWMGVDEDAADHEGGRADAADPAS